MLRVPTTSPGRRATNRVGAAQHRVQHAERAERDGLQRRDVPVHLQCFAQELRDARAGAFATSATPISLRRAAAGTARCPSNSRHFAGAFRRTRNTEDQGSSPGPHLLVPVDDNVAELGGEGQAVGEPPEQRFCEPVNRCVNAGRHEARRRIPDAPARPSG